MKKNKLLGFVSGFICLALALPSIGSAKTPPATAEAFAAAPSISKVSISADGNRIAFGYTTATGETQVRVLDLPSKKTVGVSVGDKKLRGLYFEDGGDILITPVTPSVDLARNRKFFVPFHSTLKPPISATF